MAISFFDLASIFPKRKNQFQKIYTEVDDIYLIWHLGRILGKYTDLTKAVIKDGVNDQNKPKLFEYMLHCHVSVENVMQLTKILKFDNDKVKSHFLENNLNKIELTHEKLKELHDGAKEITQIIDLDIVSYSRHISNIFHLGMEFSHLKSRYLYGENKQEILDVVERLDTCLTNIDKGNKNLNSPNLELIHDNLKIIIVSINIIKKCIDKLFELKNKDFTLYKKKIDTCFDIWQDILLDLKNPGQIIKGQAWVIVSFYYAIIIIAGIIQVIFKQTTLDEILESMLSDTKKTEYYVTALIIPGVVFFLIFLYNFIKKNVIYILLRRKFKKIINDNG